MESNNKISKPLIRLVLVRHGARHDYADPDWAQKAIEMSHNSRDPPLSAIGLLQARETSNEIVKIVNGWGQGVDFLLVSPYLRTLQTAHPTAHALNMPISIEEGICEIKHDPTSFPCPKDRWVVFPEVDVNYKTRIHIENREGYPHDYFRRMKKFADIVEKDYIGKNIICFSHAASVALVASLMRIDLWDLKLAPCGIFELHFDGSRWHIIRHGHDNTSHVSANCPKTFPWGFCEEKFGVAWKEFKQEHEQKNNA